MVIELTDAQIVRLFDLCERISKIKTGMPKMPQGFSMDENARLELAKAARGALEAENQTLVEIGALLR